MTLAKKKDDILYWGIVGLILYMPLHYYLCELLLRGTGFDNLLRDAVIALLAAMVFFRKDTFKEPLSILVTASIVLIAVMGTISTLCNQVIPILNIARTYIVPMLIFFAAKNVCLSKERFARLNILLTVELAVISLYGFIQAFFLTDDFLIFLGYPNNGEFLSSYSFYISHFYGYQRTVGTFISPNIFGAILAVALCVLLFTDNNRSFKWKYIWGTLIMVGLVTTYSRSAWVGLAMATAFTLLLSKAWTRLSKKTIRRGALVLLTFAVFVVFDHLVLDGLCREMFFSTVFRTFNGQDPSAGAHIEHLTAPPVSNLDTLPDADSDSSLGAILRFGLNGPMANEFLDNATNVESSLYLMVYELGIVGALLYFAPYVLLIVRTIRNRKSYSYFAPAAICLVVLVTYVFLPNVQTFEIPFYCFLFMGLYDNPSVKALYVRPTE